MGKRGPKPKPSIVRILEGNPGRLPINPDEPFVNRPPAMPSAVAMDELAALEWDRICSVMPAGVYTAADSAVLTQYALAWAMLIRAQCDIEAYGQLIKEPITHRGVVLGHTYKENPAIKSWRAAQAVLMQTTDRLGLSPGERSRLKAPQNAKPISKFAGLIA